MVSEIKIKCRRCGRQSLADDFVLDHDYKMMVCPSCIQEKKLSNKKKAAVAKGELDDSLSITEAAQPQLVSARTINALPQKNSVSVHSSPKPEPYAASKPVRALREEAPIGNKIKVNCDKCNYKFSYDTDRRYPSKCPYCGTPVIHS